MKYCYSCECFTLKAVLGSKLLNYPESKNIAESDIVANLLGKEHSVMLWEKYTRHLPHNNEGPLDTSHMTVLISITSHLANLCWAFIHSLCTKEKHAK